MKMDYQNKIILSALIFVLAAGGLIYFAILPTAETIRNMQAATADQAAQVEKDYAEGNSLKKVADNLKIVEPQLPQLDKALIKQAAGIDFITAVEQAAARSNVEIKHSFGEETMIDSTDGKIPMTITSQGLFNDQLNFLSVLESLSYYINVNSLKLTVAAPLQAPVPGEPKSLIMQLSADTYWQE